MPQRNSQNPTKAVKKFSHKNINQDASAGRLKKDKSAGVCPNCRADVPPKPGFRFSSLKCPKCGASMGNK